MKARKKSKETAINKLADSLESSQMAAVRVALVKCDGFGIDTVRGVSGCARSLCPSPHIYRLFTGG